MIDLRDRLRELADAATREGATPGPAHAIRRGRQRRRHIVGGVAALLVVASVAGAAGSGRMPVRTTSRPVVPAATTPPTRVSVPAPLPDLQVEKNRPPTGSLQAEAFDQLATELRRCPGGSSIPADVIGYLWSAKYRRLAMVAAKQPPPQETRFCSTIGFFGASNGFVITGARRVGSKTTPLTSSGNIESGFAQIYGRVTKQASRVRLRFRDRRPPMDLVVIETGNRYPVDFYVGFFAQAPTSPQEGGWAAATVTALDAAGRTVASCRVGPPGDGTPKCPGN
jgi:hypothetical protein